MMRFILRYDPYTFAGRPICMAIPPEGWPDIEVEIRNKLCMEVQARCVKRIYHRANWTRWESHSWPLPMPSEIKR